MNRMGLWPVASPYNITRMQCFGYIPFIHTGVLWVLCMFFDHGSARYRIRTCTLKGSIRFMYGIVWIPVDFIRAWEYDYLCGHRADAINGLGNIRMIGRAWSYRAR